MVSLTITRSCLLLATLLGLAASAPQRPTPPPSPATQGAHRDTVRLIVQPPPTVNIEAPSQVPTVVFGVLGALLLSMQLWIMARQTSAMNRQTALLDQQAVWRRDEAIGTFYRIAFDLVDELRKANVLMGTPIPANYNTHPRHMLRQASRLFAPLGNDFIFSANEIALRLDQYFSAVLEYNGSPGGREGADQLLAVDALREQVGKNLDRASHLIAEALRWRYGDGTDYDFAKLCAPPRGLRGERDADEKA